MNELIERLEAATGPDRELDALIACAAKAGLPSGCDWAFKFPNWGSDGRSGRVNILGNINGNGDYIAGHFTAPTFTASIDAALMLCGGESGLGSLIAGNFPDGTRGWVARVRSPETADGEGKTPALAICIAALKAHSTGMEGNGNG